MDDRRETDHSISGFKLKKKNCDERLDRKELTLMVPHPKVFASMWLMSVMITKFLQEESKRNPLKYYKRKKKSMFLRHSIPLSFSS